MQNGETDRGAHRRIYSITKKGRAQLVKWLSVPPQPESPRNEMLLKLFFGSQVPTHILIENVKRMVVEHRAMLEKYTEMEKEKKRSIRTRSLPMRLFGEYRHYSGK